MRIREAGAAAVDRVEGELDRVFGAAANPLRHLGAVGFHLFWVIVASGVYLYVPFDTSVDGARESVAALSESTPGRLARGLHRYASDAFVVVVALHLVREWLLGRFSGARWFPWVTGVALLWLIYLSGIGGYWLLADQVAQYSLIATAEWLDRLPLAALAAVRNFVASGQLSDRLFSLLVFLHVGVPLLLLLGMWLHVQRVVRAAVTPDRALGAGVLTMLSVLALAWPAPLTAPMDLATSATELPLDWFLLFIHPLSDATSPTTAWVLALGVTALLAAQPWLARTPVPPPAVVSPSDCNGCGRCFADCPYAAVVVGPRSDGRHAAGLARVLPDLCTGCGICAGACPSSTPFRSSERLVSGIDLPGRPLAVLRETLDAALEATATASGDGGSPDAARVIVFGCEHAIDGDAIGGARTAAIPLTCVAQLPPSFVEYALRSGADAVAVVACPPGGCRFRAGPMLLEQRFAARREPHLRPSVPRERLLVVHAARHERARVRAEIGRLRERLAELKPAAPNGSEPGHAHLAPKRRDARRNARRARAPGESAPARPAVAPLNARGPTPRVSSFLDPSESDHG